MPNILLVVKHAELDVHNARMMVKIAQETASEDAPIRSAKGQTAAGDERKLRGIPCLAPGVGGGMAQTLPHVEGVRRADLSRSVA